MLSLLMAQLNPTVGALDHNRTLVEQALAEGQRQKVRLVVLPELFLTGYPPEDLVLKPDFVQACRRAVEALAPLTANGSTGLLVGTPWVEGGKLYNAAVWLDGGTVAAVAKKRELPNYGVFDEKRYFTPAADATVLAIDGVKVGVAICEDIWFSTVTADLKRKGAQLIVSPNGSPYEMDKRARRLDVAKARVAETGLPLAYVNQWGGQDELVFDGRSFTLSPGQDPANALAPWADAYQRVDVTVTNGAATLSAGPSAPEPERLADIYAALVCGLRDYVTKNGFKSVLLGLSGGIDSALTAAIAVDALGPKKVMGLLMPSPYSSQHSLDDAHDLARRLGVDTRTIAIQPAMDALAALLASDFANLPPNEAEENIQARLRGVLLMAYSNKFGGMLLTTGNKSEMSVGYATLYGDMNGGYNALKDVYKTTVFELARWRNTQGEVIPPNSIQKPPSAELRPNQTDQDSLPPYDLLDRILKMAIEERKGIDDVVAAGIDPATAKRIFKLLRRAEYKRRQAAPGVKITATSFGRDFRFPITNGYREAAGV
jgi:NAD+ synthase